MDGGRARLPRPGQIDGPGPHAGGEEHLVVTRPPVVGQECLCGYLLPGHERHPGRRRAGRQVLQRGTELLLAGNAAGEPELPAGLGVPVEQGDLVPEPGRTLRGRQARRPGTDHGDPAPAAEGHRDGRGVLRLRLPPGAGVHQARDLGPGEHVVEAGLVAGDARGQGPSARVADRGHPLGVRQQGPGQPDERGGPGRQRLLRLGGGGQPVGGDHGDVDGGGQVSRGGEERGARHGGHDGRHTRLVPPDAGHQDVRSGGLEGPGGVRDLRARLPVGDEVRRRGAHREHAALPQRLAHGRDHRHREPASALGVTPVLVRASVRRRGEELVEEVALRGHDLHAVVSGLQGQRGRACERVHGPLDVRGRHLPGRVPRDRRSHRGGRDQVGAGGVASRVQQLGEDPAPGCVDGVRDDAMGARVLLAGEHPPAQRHRALGDDAQAAGDDESDAAACPLRVERRQLRQVVVPILQSHVHRGHDHPVGQREGAQSDRLEQGRDRDG